MTTITNNLGLPEAIVRAVANDSYSRGGADISITGLLKPARATALEAAHVGDLTEDAADRIWALTGQLIHTLLERSGGDAIREERLSAECLGWTVSGAMDELAASSDSAALDINDWKFSTVWKFKDGVPADHVAQVNGYAWLLRENGFAVGTARITAIYRDWSKLEAKRDSAYPHSQVQVFQVPLWDAGHAVAWVEERVRAHQEARVVLPECTVEERWAKSDRWAVTKRGNSRATKLCDSEAEAAVVAAGLQAAVRKPDSYTITRRPGESTRCAHYCAAAPYCTQWQAIRMQDGE